MLASKTSDGGRVLEEIIAALAEKSGTTVEVLKAAQSMCVFEPGLAGH